MRRFWKLLGMIFIFGMVFFIITDEKGYKIGFENNQIVFNEIEKKTDSVEVKFDSNAVYKNSDLIHLNYEFENPKNLRKSVGVDSGYLVKQEVIQNTGTTKQEVIQNTGITKQEIKQNTGTTKQEVRQNTGITKQEIKQNTGTTKQEIQNTGTTKQEVKRNTGTTKHEVKQNTGNIIKESDKQFGNIVLYKNSNIITLYSGFENPQNLRKAIGVDEEFIANEKKKQKGPGIVVLDDGDTISNIISSNINDGNTVVSDLGFEYGGDNFYENDLVTGVEKTILETVNNKTGNLIKTNNETGIVILDMEEDINYSGAKNDDIQIMTGNIIVDTGDILYEKVVKIDKYNLNNHPNVVKKAVYIEDVNQVEERVELKDTIVDIVSNSGESIVDTGGIIVDMGNNIENKMVKIDKYKLNNHPIVVKKAVNIEKIVQEEKKIPVEKPELFKHSIQLSKGIVPEIRMVKIDKYQLRKHDLYLKKGKIMEYNFVVNDDVANLDEVGGGVSDSVLQDLLENEEIDINTLESENDEFLQKVFEKTGDKDVMNLIIETYLTEYQFVKAKKFIESLSDENRDEIKPSLNLRVFFNSFPLTSKTINDSLNSLIQDYVSKGKITEETKNRYMGVIELMNRNYNRFFEISAGFTSESNKDFASKLQGYKEQISKQMGMPEYYFDTLVSFELFNQGLFQPAKVLALYSLQNDSNYILPYQVLAYANFLTNSRDTSIEYFKKLVDLDPNNAEKYHFLMGVASYWDEKYEQSVVMLSVIKDEKLRLDTQRYLINNYIKLNQRNKLISSWNKLLGYENLVASDFYTYFYETFYRPYSEGNAFQIYAFDTELANKMLHVCAIKLPADEKAVCTYGTIGKNIALGQFDGLENLLLNLTDQYPQGYLYQALGEYYVQQGDMEKAKIYLIKAISLTQNKSERSQIKKLLQDAM